MRHPGRFAPVLWACAAAALTFIAYLPALNADFVNWDDDMNFLLNEQYRGLSPAHLKWMFTTFHMGHYQPLSWMTLGFDYTLWGMNARGYHLTNVLLHAMSAAVMVAVAAAFYARATAGNGSAAGSTANRPASLGFAAFATAVLFSLHPLRVESVAWVTERRDVLSGFFFFLAILALLSTPRRPRLAFGAWVLSLLSKATGVTLPLLLLILDVYPLRRLPGDPRRWLQPPYRAVVMEKVPYFVVAFAVGIVALAAQSKTGALEKLENFGPPERLALAAYALVFYVVKSVLPIGLSPKYEIPDSFHALNPLYVASGLLLVVITILAFREGRRRPAVPAAWIAYLVLVIPVAGIARVGHVMAADRYTYLSAVPLTLLAGAWLLGGVRADGGTGAGRRVSAVPPGRAAAALLILVLLGAATYRQTTVWTDSVSLWRHGLKQDPVSETMALSLAFALVEVGRHAEAEVVYRDLLRKDPALADARYNYAMLLLKDGRPAEAEAEFLRLTGEAPGFAGGHYGLGVVYMLQRKIDLARSEFETSLRLDPGQEGARRALEEGLKVKAGTIDVR